ncbi:hypothetical protein [Paracoccus marinus]|uniref:hypothetical protein n=1 Tax=Paracoccus marinus TaxID=288426 RepID=UPI001C8F4C8B|nr:hypothetical protein [Paracoccus marinus]
MAEPVLVGSVCETHPVAVPEGIYDLVFEALPGAGGYIFTLRLTFAPTREGTFRIVRRGGDITADQVLRATAEPAL